MHQLQRCAEQLTFIEARRPIPQESDCIGNIRRSRGYGLSGGNLTRRPEITYAAAR